MFNCPYHSDNTPSLSVNSELGLYNCFSCGCKGNIYTLAKELDYELPKINKLSESTRIFDEIEQREEKIKLNRLAIKHFYNANISNLTPLQSYNNNKEVDYFINKKLDREINFNYIYSKPLYYVANCDIYYNNNIYLKGSLVIITDSLVQIIHKDNYKAKQFLKYSILKGACIDYCCDKKVIFLSEGIANHLSLQYISNEFFSNSFGSICCFSSSNLEYHIKEIPVKTTSKKFVVCIDNDPAGYKVKEVAKSKGINNFIEFADKPKNYDISNCFVDDIDYLLKQIKENIKEV